MTAKEIERAARLHVSHRLLVEVILELDKSAPDGPMIDACLTALSAVRKAFLSLTDRLPEDTRGTDFSITSPAEWVKNHGSKWPSSRAAKQVKRGGSRTKQSGRRQNTRHRFVLR